MAKFESPKISEFMTGTVVLDPGVPFIYSNVDSMKIFIPAIMLDKSPNPIPSTVGVMNIFKSKESIFTSSTVKSLNYIMAKTSDAFKYLYDPPKKIYNGDKIRIYIPKLNIDDAVIIPM